jgi:hypothetical protein
VRETPLERIISGLFILFGLRLAHRPILGR